MRRLSLSLAAVVLAGCGYVGDPLPPALNLAKRIEDLRVVEYGDRLMVDFTIPLRTTDNLRLRTFREVDLRIGHGSNPFDQNTWAAQAKKVAVKEDESGPAQVEIPVKDWADQDIVIAVRIVNTRGKASDWSNLAVLHVVPPVPKPTGLKPEADPAGVKLIWTSAAPKFRVFRHLAGTEGQPVMVGSPDATTFIDTAAEYGKHYEYMVQALDRGAESEITAAADITPRDTFPPATPAGLNALGAIGTVELVWERNTETDLKGYRVYRALEGRDFERIAEMVEAPAYSDKQVESGKKYRYAVSAVDQSGNESGRSTAVEVTAP